MEMTIEQKRAIALASARLRAEQQPEPAPALDAGDVAADVAKSAGSGVVRGVAGMAGIGGDLSKAAGAGLDVLERKGVPVEQSKQTMLDAMPSWLRRFHEKPAAPIGSQEIMGGIDKAAGLPVTSYEPKTIAGTYARTVGEMAPAAAMGGVGFVRGAVLPGIMSEGAGQLTKGSSLETPARIAGAVAAGFVPRVGADVLGNLGTGTGSQSVKTAYQAGVRGGESGKAFRDNMRGNVPIDEVVADAKTAVSNMRQARSAAYEDGMSGMRAAESGAYTSAPPLKFDAIDAAITKSNNVKNFKGIDLAPETAKVRGQIDDVIEQWKGLNPLEYHTPLGMDALKQRIGSIKDSLPFNTPERLVAERAYSAVRDTIVKQAPEYAKTMKGYEQASNAISEMEKTLSLNPRASVDTSLRKLQSVTRNNVNTNYGKRAELAETLAANGAPNLMEKLSGQAMNTWTPRGINKVAASMLGASSYFNPMALAALPLMSPRLVGEVSHGVGRVAGAMSAPSQVARRAIGLSAHPQIDEKRAALIAGLIASREQK